MILTIDIDELDPELVKFYEKSDNKSKIQDALIHGHKIVHSNTYALNLKNSNETHTHKIDQLSIHNQQLQTEVSDLKIAKQIEIDKNSQQLVAHFNQQKQELDELHQKKMLNLRESVQNEYKMVLEVVVDDKFFEPLKLTGSFEKSLKVTAEAVVRAPRKKQTSVTASLNKNSG